MGFQGSSWKLLLVVAGNMSVPGRGCRFRWLMLAGLQLWTEHQREILHILSPLFMKMTVQVLGCIKRCLVNSSQGCFWVQLVLDFFCSVYGSKQTLLCVMGAAGRGVEDGMAANVVDFIGDGWAEKVLMFFVPIHFSFWFNKLPQCEPVPVGSPLAPRGTGRWWLCFS